MTKCVLVGQVDPNSATGEMVWEQETMPSAGDSMRVWIGKVSTRVYHRKCTVPPEHPTGPYHVTINVLYSPRPTRSGLVRSQRMPVRFWRIHYHQWFEKVLIAQEWMATNHVYVFAKAQPSPISFLAEIRSAVEIQVSLTLNRSLT